MIIIQIHFLHVYFVLKYFKTSYMYLIIFYVLILFSVSSVKLFLIGLRHLMLLRILQLLLPVSSQRHLTSIRDNLVKYVQSVPGFSYRSETEGRSGLSLLRPLPLRTTPHHP